MTFLQFVDQHFVGLAIVVVVLAVIVVLALEDYLYLYLLYTRNNDSSKG